MQLTELQVKKAFYSITLLWVGSVSGAGFAFLTHVILARILGPEEFGIFGAAYSVAVLMFPLAGFGIAQFWLKEFGKRGWEATTHVAASLRFVSLTSLGAVAAIVLWAVVGPHGNLFRLVLLLMGLHAAGQVSVELVAARLQLEERFFALALWQPLHHIIRFVLIAGLAIVVGRGLNVVGVASVYALVAGLMVITAAVLLSEMARGHFDLKGHGASWSASSTVKPPGLVTIAAGAWPFGLAGVFYMIYFQGDIVLVKYFTGDEAAGYYNVAFIVMMGVLLFPAIIYQKYLLPKIHRWAYRDRALFYSVYRRGTVVMFGIGMIAFAVIWVLASPGLLLIFGAHYIEAVHLLKILALSLPISFMVASIDSTLATQEHMKTKVQLMGAVAVINILLNLWLIPFYGAVGAAAAKVASNVIMLFLYYIFAERIVFAKEKKDRKEWGSNL